jgi:hypothetical protein
VLKLSKTLKYGKKWFESALKLVIVCLHLKIIIIIIIITTGGFDQEQKNPVIFNALLTANPKKRPLLTKN